MSHRVLGAQRLARYRSIVVTCFMLRGIGGHNHLGGGIVTPNRQGALGSVWKCDRIEKVFLQNGVERLDDRRPLEMVCDHLRRCRLASVERIDTAIPILVLVVRMDTILPSRNYGASCERSRERHGENHHIAGRGHVGYNSGLTTNFGR
ncbi:hypothetical protein QTL96_27925 [Rhizobium sp. S163]|nr:hypothetical protein [Rhizobium sp. S163]MDM9649260.1 hypothetical protein [Rhizobium sp. S163]